MATRRKNDRADAYRPMDLYGMTDHISNHISVRVQTEFWAKIVKQTGAAVE